MYNQSISGIRSNLEAFNQAAVKIAQPQTTEAPAGKLERQSSRAGGPQLTLVPSTNRAASQTADQSTKAQTDYRKAASTAGKVLDKTSMIRTPTKAQDPNATKETANDPGTRSQTSQPVDQPRETVNMIMAQKGVEANLGVLKTAMSLSGQTVDILV